jgi:hypothetical protein
MAAIIAGCGGTGVPSTPSQSQPSSTPSPTPNPKTGNPVPSLSSLDPDHVAAGTQGFSVTVNGTGFVNGSTVLWNGTPLVPVLLSQTKLTGLVQDNLISIPGTASVTVSSPAPGGGTSNALTFTITDPVAPNTLQRINLLANDIVLDAKRNLLYMTVPSTVTEFGNDVVVLNPASGKVTNSVFAGSEPNHLAISDDGAFLYVGIDGGAAVQRFTLPSLTPELKIDLGTAGFLPAPAQAQSIAVVPGHPHQWGVLLNNGTGAAQGAELFDDDRPRPAIADHFNGTFLFYDQILAGSRSDELYAFQATFGGNLFVLQIAPDGLHVAREFAGVIQQSFPGIHFNSADKLLYADAGNVVDPGTGLPVGKYDANGAMAPDSGTQTAFFANTNFALGDNKIVVSAFDLSHFTLRSSVTLTGTAGVPRHAVRFGADGLAITTQGVNGPGQVYLLRGPFVASGGS